MMSRKREIVTRKLIPFISLLGNLFRSRLYVNSSLHLRLFVSLSDQRGSYDFTLLQVLLYSG